MIHEAAMTVDMESLAINTKHSLARDAGLVAKEARAGRLMLVHMFDRYIGHSEALVAEASREFSGEVLVPEELKAYSL